MPLLSRLYDDLLRPALYSVSGGDAEQVHARTLRLMALAERRPDDPKVVKVTEATLTYVAIDRDGRPRPVPKH